MFSSYQYRNPSSHINSNYAKRRIIGFRRGIDGNIYEWMEDTSGEFEYWKRKEIDIHEEYQIFSNYSTDRYCDYEELTNLKQEIEKLEWKMIEIEPNRNSNIYKCFANHLFPNQHHLKYLQIMKECNTIRNTKGVNNEDILKYLSQKYQLNVTIYSWHKQS